jgi:hypothetical protein
MFDELLGIGGVDFICDQHFLNTITFFSSKDAGLQPWRVSRFYMFAVTAPPMTHFVPLDSHSLARKIAAFDAHRSQVQGNTTYISEYFTWLARRVGANAGLSAGTFAEGYTAYW